MLTYREVAAEAATVVVVDHVDVTLIAARPSLGKLHVLAPGEGTSRAAFDIPPSLDDVLFHHDPLSASWVLRFGAWLWTSTDGWAWTFEGVTAGDA